MVKSSTTFRKRVCPLLYQNLHQAVMDLLKEEIPTTDGVGVTVDHWTSRAYDSYQSFTIHYVNEEFLLRKVKVVIKFLAI